MVLPLPLLIYFQYAYDWLNMHLNHYYWAADLWRRNMRYAAETSGINLVADLGCFMAGVTPAGTVYARISQMIEISNGSINPLERAEIQLACARAYFVLGDYPNTFDQLDTAIQVYASDLHNQAVVMWMKGIVHLAMGMDVDNAIRCWQRSLDGFNLLARSQRVGMDGANWYQSISGLMQAALDAVI